MTVPCTIHPAAVLKFIMAVRGPSYTSVLLLLLALLTFSINRQPCMEPYMEAYLGGGGAIKLLGAGKLDPLKPSLFLGLVTLRSAL
eukprot:1156879-Pelagomonas_calceolata.AAC.3